ncbi:MAG: HEAT repeat domain-containing protein [Victivallales bacterium]|nr:HEAT repeat domain-containing protein [Victivallales bacterium]
MDNITKAIIIASIVIIAVLAVFIFRGGQEEPEQESEKTPAVKVERPKGRRPLGNNAEGDELQEFVASSEESKQAMQGIAKTLLSGSEDEIADAIIEMENLGTEDILALFDTAMRIKNPEYRRDIITRVQALPHRGAVAALAKAMNDRDPSVRQLAIGALAMTEGMLHDVAEKAKKAAKDRLTLEEEDKAQVAAAIKQAINDSDEEVRQEVLEALPMFSADFQNYGINTAIEAEDKNVRSNALFLAQSSFNKETINAVITAIGDKNKKISEQAIDFMQHMFDQEFTSSKEAREWWERNSYKYDYDLVEQQEDD